MLKRAAVILLGLAVLLAVVATSGCGSGGSAPNESRDSLKAPAASSFPTPQIESSAPTPVEPATPAGDEYDETGEEDAAPPVLPEETTEPTAPSEPVCPT